MPQLMTNTQTNVYRSRTCRMLIAIRKAYRIVLLYASRMNVAEPPREMPNAAEQHAHTARKATRRIGQNFNTFTGVSCRGFRYTYPNARMLSSKAGLIAASIG